MKKTIIGIVVTIVSIGITLSLYTFTYIHDSYNLSYVQILLLIFVIISACGIATALSFEYLFTSTLDEFLINLRKIWNKDKSLDLLQNIPYPIEIRSILDTINDIVKENGKRIKELESKGGYTDDYYRLISTISHQLRTPITGLNWALESLENDIKNKKDIDVSMVRNAVEANSRIGDLVEELLVGMGDPSLRQKSFGAIDIENILTDVIADSSLLGVEYDMEIKTVKLYPVIPLVKGISKEIKFVLHSLITNALNYGEHGTPVTITLGYSGDFVNIDIHNGGSYINNDEKIMLFARFNRGSEAIRINPDGSGLGLYLAKNIMLNHGGALKLKESSKKNGTTFTLNIPLSNRGELETSINN